MGRWFSVVALAGAIASASFLTLAGVMGQPGGSSVVRRAAVPGLGADGGRLPFPTVPPAFSASENCRTYLWDFGPSSPGSVPKGLFAQNARAWISGFTGEGVPLSAVLSFDLPPDAVEAVVIVDFLDMEGSRALSYGYALWGNGEDWSQTIPIDPRAYELGRARVTVCWKTGVREPAWSVDLTFANGVATGSALPGGFEVWAGAKGIVLPAHTIAGAKGDSFVFRFNGGNLVPVNPLPLKLGGQNDVPFVAIDASNMLLAPGSLVVDAVGLDGGRTGFLVQTVTNASVWNPVITLSGFPNGASFPFPVPKVIYPSEPVYFSLNITNSVLGTYQLSGLRATLSGGGPVSNAPAGAGLVYGQPGVVWDGTDVDVVVSLCNPTGTPITVTNAGIDAWHLDANGTPNAAVFGTFAGTVAPHSCSRTDLPISLGRDWSDADILRVIREHIATREFIADREAALSWLNWVSTGSPAIR